MMHKFDSSNFVDTKIISVVVQKIIFWYGNSKMINTQGGVYFGLESILFYVTLPL